MTGTAVLLLQAAEGAASPLQSPFVPILAMLALFYLFLIRPEQRKRKQHEEMLKSIDKGDSVITVGGLHGKVVGVTDDTLTLEIAALKGERVRVKVARAKVEARDKADRGEKGDKGGDS